jgi:hypothetical protein
VALAKAGVEARTNIEEKRLKRSRRKQRRRWLLCKPLKKKRKAEQKAQEHQDKKLQYKDVDILQNLKSVTQSHQKQ